MTVQVFARLATYATVTSVTAIASATSPAVCAEMTAQMGIMRVGVSAHADVWWMQGAINNATAQRVDTFK
jgi:hypothetical protein